MTEPMEFAAAGTRREPIPFKIAGEDFVYDFTPPKIAVGSLPSMLDGASNVDKAAFDWLGKGLPEDHLAHLIARLRDNDDVFDVPDLTGIIRGLMGRVTGRPTT